MLENNNSSLKLNTNPYKGTRDFYPDDLEIRNFIFNKIRSVLKSYGYREYDGPMLEPFELYAAKTSEEIVNEQLYWLTDRGGRKLAIRPEMTPTLARMVAAKHYELPKPIRWFSIPNLWRYERPQRGRLREHWQLNVDVFGGNPRLEDLEICSLIYSIMEAFGSTKNFEVRLNHRGLTNFLFKEILKLNDEKIAPVGRLLDAALKLGIEKFEKALFEENLDKKQVEILISLLDSNQSEKVKSLFENHFTYHEIKTLIDQLKILGINEPFRFDPSIMRGFLYYTGLVFEVYDLHPENNRALFGGGRYDNLVSLFEPNIKLSGIGFGMGDVTFRNYLEVHNLLPNLKEQVSGLYLAYFTESEAIECFKIANYLRSQKQNYPFVTALEPAKVKKHFEKAEKLNMKYITFIGSQELSTHIFQIKEIQTGKIITCRLEEITKNI